MRTEEGIPPDWDWRERPAAPGPAIVVDIDGVLSDAANRQHFLDREVKDWRGFFEACADDPVIEEMKVLLDLLDPGIRVVLLTARPIRLLEITRAWLHRYEIRWDLLVMRDRRRGHESSLEFKREVVGELRGYGFDVRLGVEDDRRNVEMLRGSDVPTLYVHSGYYD